MGKDTKEMTIEETNQLLLENARLRKTITDLNEELAHANGQVDAYEYALRQIGGKLNG